MRRAIAALALLAAAALPVAATPSTPLELARSLADLGPRPTGSPASREAEALLLEAMRQAGLEEVAVREVEGARNLTGVLRGSSGREILLGAHYDTVPGSPGAGDNASGCAVALAAAVELGRTPLQHTVRVVLFDAEESGLTGSRGWVRDATDADRAALIAAIQVEMVGRIDARHAAVHTFPVDRPEGRVLAPGWLVHAALAAGQAIGFPLAVSDARFPVSAQLYMRSGRLAVSSDADAFLGAGIPAVLLSDLTWTSFDREYHQPGDVPARLDPARLDQWTAGVTAVARRLDGLAGRPRSEDRYVAAFGRVWHRRDLYWLGFLVWISLVWRGRPGRWRDTETEVRQARGREYLPGFFYRVAFLVALLLAPVFAMILVVPTGIAALVMPSRPRWRYPLAAVATLPLALYLLFGLWMAWRGFLIGLTSPTLGAAAVLAALAAFAVLVVRGAADESGRV